MPRARSLSLLTKLLPVMGQPVQFSYRVTVLATQATTPKFTFAAGYPAAFVNWGDGSALDAVTSGVELNHVYGSNGTYTVRLVMPQQASWITQIDLNGEKISNGVTAIQKFPKLTRVFCQGMNYWVQDITNWALPASLTFFWNYLSIVVGNITNWVLPAGLTDFRIYQTGMTGVPVLTSMVSIEIIQAQNLALNQASVDLWLSRCVAREAATTYATPTLNLGGTNAAPSAQGVTDAGTLTTAGWVVTVTA